MKTESTKQLSKYKLLVPATEILEESYGFSFSNEQHRVEKVAPPDAYTSQIDKPQQNINGMCNLVQKSKKNSMMAK